ncbi:MAG: EthD family reductase, partial [Solirubrobacteraceae bacterium]
MGYGRHTRAHRRVHRPAFRRSTGGRGLAPDRRSHRPMHKLVVLYPPPADPDKFRSYYTSTHLKLVEKLPGLRAYR